jgi:hypothetical protein
MLENERKILGAIKGENWVVDVNGLAGFLQCSPFTLRKIWRSYPHFFVGQGRDLRGARFDVNDVLAFLKRRGGNYGYMERQKERVDSEVSVPKKKIQKRRIQVQAGGHEVGNYKKGRSSRPNSRDPFHLLPRTGD